jgi:hypothetical protein
LENCHSENTENIYGTNDGSFDPNEDDASFDPNEDDAESEEKKND